MDRFLCIEGGRLTLSIDVNGYILCNCVEAEGDMGECPSRYGNACAPDAQHIGGCRILQLHVEDACEYVECPVFETAPGLCEQVMIVVYMAGFDPRLHS